MSHGLSTISLKFFCYETTFRTRRVCQFISLFDIATAVILSIKFRQLLDVARIDEIIFDFGTLTAALIQLITALLSFGSVTFWGNLKFVPYHQSAKLTFLVCFILERIVKNVVECYAFRVPSPKCETVIGDTIFYLFFVLIEMYLIFVLKLIKLKMQQAYSRAFQMYMQPDQEQVMDGIGVEVAGFEFKGAKEGNAPQIVASFRFTIDEKAKKNKIKVKQTELVPKIMIFDEVNLIQEMTRISNIKEEAKDEPVMSLNQVISAQNQESNSKSREEGDEESPFTEN